MKPIFEKERKNLNHYYPFDIVPENCWIDNGKIYLNFFDKDPLLTFIVDMKGISSFIDITPYEGMLRYRERIKNEINLTREEEYELLMNKIEAKEKQSIEYTKNWIKKYNNLQYKIVVSISGGKDSDLTKHIIDKTYQELELDKNYDLIAFNSTNETAQTYIHLKKYHGLTKDNIKSPEKGWHKFIQEDKDYYVPTTISRYCCDVYKEGKMKKVYDTKEKLLIILGMRKDESHKRSFYEFDLNKAWLDHYSQFPKNKRKPLNVPTNWKRFLPIVEWTDIEVWLYLIHNKIQLNPMYELGFERCGCLICPMASTYSLYLVEKYYPKQWNRWVEILSENYERKNIRKQLKWDEIEYIYGGHWKNFSSLEAQILNRKPNDNNIEYLAYLKGCSYDVAKSFYNKKCKCGKKLNPKETAMSFKFGNRNDDNCLCKKCLCNSLNINEEEYSDFARTFIEQGCTLF